MVAIITASFVIIDHHVNEALMNHNKTIHDTWEYSLFSISIRPLINTDFLSHINISEYEKIENMLELRCTELRGQRSID